jgi:hypothetical protein
MSPQESEKKVLKTTGKSKFVPVRDMKTHTGSRGTAPLIRTLGTKLMYYIFSVTLPPLSTGKKTAGPFE